MSAPQASAQDEQAARSHYEAGVAAQARQDANAAIREFREAVRIAPRSAAARFQLGFTLAAKGNYKAAIDELLIAAELEPSNPAAHYYLGAAHYFSGNTEAAIEPLSRASRLAPDNPDAHFYLGAALRQRAGMSATSSSPLAVDAANTSARLPLAPAETRGAMGVMVDAKGAMVDGEDDLDAAILALKQAARLRPTSSATWIELGLAFVDRRDPAAAIDSFNRALALGRDSDAASLVALHNLGMAQLQKGDHEQAIATYRRLVLLAPTRAEAHYNLALALKNRDRLAVVQ